MNVATWDKVHIGGICLKCHTRIRGDEVHLCVSVDAISTDAATDSISVEGMECPRCNIDIPQGMMHYCSPETDDLQSLMVQLANMGHHVFVRIDALRSERRFTIVHNGQRLCDTDDPCKHLVILIGDIKYSMKYGAVKHDNTKTTSK